MTIHTLEAFDLLLREVWSRDRMEDLLRTRIEELEVEEMPYKSEAQRKAMNAKAARGEVPQGVVDEMNKASKGKKLPARAKKKAKK